MALEMLLRGRQSLFEFADIPEDVLAKHLEEITRSYERQQFVRSSGRKIHLGLYCRSFRYFLHTFMLQKQQIDDVQRQIHIPQISEECSNWLDRLIELEGIK